MQPEGNDGRPSSAKVVVPLPLEVGFYEGTAKDVPYDNWTTNWTLEILGVTIRPTDIRIRHRKTYRTYDERGKFRYANDGAIENLVPYRGSKFHVPSEEQLRSYKEWDYMPSPYAVEELFASADTQCKRTPMDWGQLCTEAASSIRSLDLNGLAFLKESFDVVKALAGIASGDISKISKLAPTSILDLLKKEFKTPRAVSRQIAKDVARGVGSDYLATHYGVRLSLQDYASVMEHVERLQRRSLYQRASAQRQMELPYSPVITSGSVHYLRRVNATVRSYSDDLLHATTSVAEAEKQLLQRISRSAYELDITPSLANLWDLVPFSFVIDWFLPIGDQLSKIENKNYASTLPVVAACYTELFEWTRPAPSLEGWSASGELQYRLYKRQCSRTLVTPTLVSPENPLTSLPRHWVEGAALITQLFK